jgi:kynurenine formamidase
MLKIVTVSILCILLACEQKQQKPVTMAEVMSQGQLIDLTHEFSDQTIYWPNNPSGFELDTQFNGITAGGYYYSSNVYCTPEHGGTHMDAPVHFAKGKWSLAEIPVDRLTGSAIVVDIVDACKNNPDYQASVADLEKWEKKNGPVPDESFILFRTGWSNFYSDPAHYLGTAQKGEAAIPQLHFPSVHPELAEWLVKNRKVKGLGIDTPSVDYGQSKDFKTHQILYAANIPGLENLTELDQLPAVGSWLFAFPMKIKDGTGGPLRAIAWIKN